MATQQPTKKQKVEDNITTYKEEVLFNSDTLSKVISYLPSVDLLNLALTCKRFGVSNNNDVPSLIEESARIAIQDIATEEELVTLPYYNGENSLANYHYLQFMTGPLTFDRLVGSVEYLNMDDKSCVKNNTNYDWGTAFRISLETRIKGIMIMATVFSAVCIIHTMEIVALAIG